jgi:hypothetical protein
VWFLVVFDSDFHAQTMSATDDVMKIAENIVCEFDDANVYHNCYTATPDHHF